MITAATNTSGSKVVKSLAPPVTLALAVAAFAELAMVEINDAPITMLISKATKIPPDMLVNPRCDGAVYPLKDRYAETMLRGRLCIVRQIEIVLPFLTNYCSKDLIPSNTQYPLVCKS